MFKYLGMAMLAVCCFAFQGKAVEDVALVIPYKVECVKKSDGTKVIQVSACLRTTAKGVVVGGLVSNQYKTDDRNFTFSSLTTILQSKESCETLDAMVNLNGTIHGYPAQKVSGDETYTFKFPVPNAGLEIKADLCVFFVDVSGCKCSSDKDFANTYLRVEEGDTLAWIPLDFEQIDNETEITAFENDPYSDDLLLVEENFDSRDLALEIEDYLIRLAMQKLHGTPCCFPSFGMNDESVNALTLQIIDKMQSCPQDFNAKGTWGSCGDTAGVKVTGTMTKPIIIDVCGKKLCFTPLPSVDSSLTTVQGFLKFFASFSSDVLKDKVDAFKCGYQDEICQLVNGEIIQTTKREFFYQLRLMCVDKESNTYGFALIKSGHNEGIDVASFSDLGVRFKLEECPKCCK